MGAAKIENQAALDIKSFEGPSFSELPKDQPQDQAPGPRLRLQLLALALALARWAPAAWDRVQVTGASIGHGCWNKMGGPLNLWPVTHAAGGA